MHTQQTSTQTALCTNDTSHYRTVFSFIQCYTPDLNKLRNLQSTTTYTDITNTWEKICFRNCNKNREKQSRCSSFRSFSPPWKSSAGPKAVRTTQSKIRLGWFWWGWEARGARRLRAVIATADRVFRWGNTTTGFTRNPFLYGYFCPSLNPSLTAAAVCLAFVKPSTKTHFQKQASEK